MPVNITCDCKSGMSFRNMVFKILQSHSIFLPKVEFGTSDEHLEEIVFEYVNNYPNSDYEEVRVFLKTRKLPVSVT